MVQVVMLSRSSNSSATSGRRREIAVICIRPREEERDICAGLAQFQTFRTREEERCILF